MGQNYIGERFGDYILVRPLGEGGFASVYLGKEVRKGTPAAVKLLKEQQVHDFINELRRTVLLQHPHIVKILDFDIRKSDNTAFIVMEYAPNGSLRDMYPSGTRVPLHVIVPTVKQVASALLYAHDRRVIHRDVKPENLLLNTQNQVLLSDFGIATASRTTMTANAEQAGQGGRPPGTCAYMSPEQFRSRPVPASDQYSLAVMVYEWLCSERPFEAQEYIQWQNQHENEPPPPLRDHIPSLTPAVEQVVLRALAKRPEERFDRVETFALALERAARGEDVSAVMNTPGPTQFEPSPMGRPSPTPSNSIEQLFQEGVRAQANGKTEEAFRIWRRVMTTSGVAERYSTTARNRIRELRTQMIPLRLKQAREASMQGRWQDEIRLWEDVLALEPSAQELTPLLKSPLTLGKASSNLTQTIQQRLQIARQNEQAAWMYEGAQQFIHDQDNAAARTQLQMLWHDAPYYGDPAGLAKVVGLPAALNYEQAIVTEQTRLEQDRLKQERLERARQEQARQDRLRQEQAQQEQEQLRQEQARLEREQEQAWQKRKNRIVLIMLLMGGIVGGWSGLVVGGLGGGVIAGLVVGGLGGGAIAGRVLGVLGGMIGILAGATVGVLVGYVVPGGAFAGGGVGVEGGIMGGVVGVIGVAFLAQVFPAEETSKKS